MEAKDLRIGSWVRIDSLTDGSTTEVEAYVFHIDEMIWTTKYKYSPIPLTEEWLVKFGFEEDSCNYYKIIENQEAVLYIDKLDTTFAYGYPYECSGGDLKLKHVHQLQNLYFALTNEELTIKEK